MEQEGGQVNCNEMFNAGICYVTDAYKTVCKFNEELHADLEKYRDENDKLRELVRIAVEYCDSGTCDGCPIQGENGSCPYSDMARELGIEVDA